MLQRDLNLCFVSARTSIHPDKVVSRLHKEVFLHHVKSDLDSDLILPCSGAVRLHF